MPPALLKRFLIYAKRNGFKRRVQTALERIGHFLSLVENPYISVSGGKDSSVLLHLCRRIDSSLDAVYLDMNATYPQSDALLNTYENLRRVVVADWQADLKEHGMRGKKSRIIDELVERQKEDPTLLAEYGGHFYGLRIEESAARKRLAKVRGDAFFRKYDNKWVSQPIMDWTYEDVWAYIVQNEIPYNELYNLMWDRPKHSQRVSSFTLTRETHMGTTAWTRMTHPEIFNKLVKATKEFREFT